MPERARLHHAYQCACDPAIRFAADIDVTSTSTVLARNCQASSGEEGQDGMAGTSRKNCQLVQHLPRVGKPLRNAVGRGQGAAFLASAAAFAPMPSGSTLPRHIARLYVVALRHGGSRCAWRMRTRMRWMGSEEARAASQGAGGTPERAQGNCQPEYAEQRQPGT